jgi:hypothetical protein
MRKPARLDCFPFVGSETEMLLLECRLTELYDVIDRFVIVEANVDHQDHPKPLNFQAQSDRFDQWKDKIHYVVADTLPTLAEDAGSWAREHAQREWITKGLDELGADDDDIVFQSDADEIPSILAARNVRPQRAELVSLHQRGHFWAIDWNYPAGWNGTVVGRWGNIKTLAQNRPCGPFTAMRDSRNANRSIPGGWHFSWLGGTQEEWLRKVGSFCHPEVRDRIVNNADRYYREGWHVDGQRMEPVDVDHTWPRWMQDPNNVPPLWYRPRP